ncbi:MAG: hypothetical protein MJ249_08120 [Kiritimatiellae bacterium]|nr:hypothetical protein [Kiritimatiellia bacterium]
MKTEKRECQAGGITDADIAGYKEKLYGLLYSNSSAIFANYSQRHARCIIQAFLDAANDSVEFVSGDFGAGVFCEKEIHDAITHAVWRGVKMRVISFGASDGSAARIKALSDEIDAREKKPGGEFRCVRAKLAEGASFQHFMVVDGRRYRLEEAHAEPVPNTVHAEVCCNGPAKAAFLRSVFNSIWGRIA